MQCYDVVYPVVNHILESVFSVSDSRKSNDYVQWKNATLRIVKKYRVLDDDFKRQIEKGNFFICERHYQQEDLEFTRK